MHYCVGGKTGKTTHKTILAFPARLEQECANALIKSRACRKTPIKIKKIKHIVSGNNTTITAAAQSITDWEGVFPRPNRSEFGS